MSLAKLHLCCNMSEQFGDLSKSEEIFVFGKNKPSREIWTTRHAFSSIYSLNPANKRRSLGSSVGRVSKNAALRTMHRRNKQISKTMDLLHKVKDDVKASERRREEASELLNEFDLHVHLRTSRSYCFRESLSSNKAYLEKNSQFNIQVQSKLREMGVIGEREKFIFRRPLISLASFRVIHIDVTQKALFSPAFSIENMTLGGCLRNKAKTTIEHNIRTVDLRTLFEFHIHVDNPGHIPLPKAHFFRETMRSFTRGESEQYRAMDRMEEETISTRVDLDTPFAQTWTSLISNSDDREFITMAFGLFIGIAVVKILREKLEENRDEVRMPKVYLHEVSMAVTDNISDCPLSELHFGRKGSSILVNKPSSGTNCSYPDTGNSMGNVGSFACRQLSSEGLIRTAVADSSHAQMRTRINYLTWRLSIPFFERMRVPAEERKILVISTEDAQDTPLISLLSEDITTMIKAGGVLLHQAGPFIVDCGQMQHAIEAANVSCNDLCLLYALSGCDEVPYSRHVLQKTFVEAYFSCRYIVGRLFSDEMMESFMQKDVGSVEISHWGQIEKLFAVAWVLSRQTERRRTLLEPLQSSETNWVGNVRRWIAAASYPEAR